MSVDNVRQVHNGRGNPQGNYYPSNEFDAIFSEVWGELHRRNDKLFPNESAIKDSAIYKASPLHKLTRKQEDAKNRIISCVENAMNQKEKQIIFIDGEAGTGKTVLNSSAFYELLCRTEKQDAKDFKCYMIVNHKEQVKVYADIFKKLGIEEKYGKVVSKASPFLNQHKEDDSIDVAFIDEAHLLFTQGNQGYRGKNQLDDIVKKAKIAVVMLLNLKTIITTDWKVISLFQDGSVHLTVTPYRIMTIVLAALVCVLATLFYRRFQYDRVKQLFHRQKLARMLLENGWYESESTQDSGFFKDLPATTKKEKITYFPKLYYHMEHGLLYIRTEITLGKYQDQLLHLEKKLETGLYCELVSKELKDSYVEYVLLYDTIANRITINEVQAEHGSLRLMKNVWWEYDKLPHMLIAGGTGGGKTYFILTIIEALLRSNAVMYILDPKNADLADLSVVMPEVWYKKDDITACIDRFYDGMMARSEAMKLMENYRTGENYAYLGLSPHFLIFDEYVAFMEMLTTKENAAVLNKLKQIVMLGRQAGYFLILACQRPDAKYLGDGIRDQFNFRVALGRMSELGYSMMFGEVDKDFFLKQIKGRGYVDTGNSVISEFYTPLVPKGHDFLKEIGRLSQNRQR